MSTKKNQKSISERAQQYLKENEILLRKFKLIIRPVIIWPNKKRPPLLSRLAVWIVAKQGGITDIEFNEIKK